jgi:hypothetical protein
MRKMFMPALLLALLLVACGTSERSIQTGRRIDSFDFTDPGSFEEGHYPGATLSILGLLKTNVAAPAIDCVDLGGGRLN